MKLKQIKRGTILKIRLADSKELIGLYLGVDKNEYEKLNSIWNGKYYRDLEAIVGIGVIVLKNTDWYKQFTPKDLKVLYNIDKIKVLRKADEKSRLCIIQNSLSIPRIADFCDIKADKEKVEL